MMDWIHQNRMKNWLVLVLLACNLLTISIIWMQVGGGVKSAAERPSGKVPESGSLLKHALGLTDAQAARTESVLVAWREQSKGLNDRSSETKQVLAEEIFKDQPDTAKVVSMAREIGDIQSRIELLRFQRFHELAALCTPDQRKILKPIVSEVFGKRPPKEGFEVHPPEGGQRQPEPRPDTPSKEREAKVRQNMRNDGPGPPSLEEKLDRYARKLALSETQMLKVKEVLQQAQKRGEELRARKNPDQAEVRHEQERIRNEEDEGIMRLLTEDQKEIFMAMISKRRP